MKKKIALSLFFVVGIAATTQYVVSKKMNFASGSRQVANLGERGGKIQIQWEQKLAQELSGQVRFFQRASEPNWQDKLVFEFFRGRYDVAFDSGSIKNIVLQSNQEGIAVDTSQFMERYGQNLKEYSTYKVVKSEGGRETVELRDGKGQSVGNIYIYRNAEGVVNELTVE